VYILHLFLPKCAILSIVQLWIGMCPTVLWNNYGVRCTAGHAGCAVGLSYMYLLVFLILSVD